MSNELEVTLPLDISSIRLPSQEVRLDDEDLYKEYIEVREGSGYVTSQAGKKPFLYTMWCRYNAVSFIPNPHKRHPIAHPLGWGMGCILRLQTLIYILHQSLQCWMQYHITLDRFMTALSCILKFNNIQIFFPDSTVLYFCCILLNLCYILFLVNHLTCWVVIWMKFSLPKCVVTGYFRSLNLEYDILAKWVTGVLKSEEGISYQHYWIQNDWVWHYSMCFRSIRNSGSPCTNSRSDSR